MTPLDLPDTLYAIIEEVFQNHDGFRLTYFLGRPARASTHGAVYCCLSLVNRTFKEVATDVYLAKYHTGKVDVFSTWDLVGGKYTCHLRSPPQSLWPRIRRLACWLDPSHFDETVDVRARVKLEEILDSCPLLEHLDVQVPSPEQRTFSETARIVYQHPKIRRAAFRVSDSNFSVIQSALGCASTLEDLSLDLYNLPREAIFPRLRTPGLRTLAVCSRISRGWQAPATPFPELPNDLFRDLLVDEDVRPTSLHIGYDSPPWSSLWGDLIPALDAFNATLQQVLLPLAPTLRHLLVTNSFLSRPPAPVAQCPVLQTLHLDCTTLASSGSFLRFWDSLRCKDLKHIRIDFDDEHQYYVLFIAKRVLEESLSLRKMEIGGGALGEEGQARVKAICGGRNVALTLSRDPLYPLDDR